LSEKTTVTDQSLQIEDLLNRRSHQVEDKIKSKKIENKIVLVTGGAGSR
jgi:FlaA1/EpsC-like NDP-sugar epimerase